VARQVEVEWIAAAEVSREVLQRVVASSSEVAFLETWVAPDVVT
jgi:hypothetical protein